MKYLIAISCILFCIMSLTGQSVTIDSTFGVNGIMYLPDTLNDANQLEYNRYEKNFTKDSKNRLYVKTFNFKDTISVLTRYLESGVIDNTFGQNGRLYNTSAPFLSLDNKLLTVSLKYVYGKTEVYISRYLEDGTLDSLNFGIAGTSKIEIDTPYYFLITNISTQIDGKLLILGYKARFGWWAVDYRPCIFRLNMDGKLDTSFGMDGFIEYKHNPDNYDVLKVPLEAFTLKDHKIIVFGTNQSSDNVIIIGRNDFSLKYLTARYLANGILDSLYGYEGQIISDQAIDFSSIILDENDRFFAMIYEGLVKFRLDGIPDASFAENFIIKQLSDSVCYGGFLDFQFLNKEQLLILGSNPDSLNYNWGNCNYYLMSIDTLGVPDSSFGDNGKSNLGVKYEDFSLFKIWKIEGDKVTILAHKWLDETRSIMGFIRFKIGHYSNTKYDFSTIQINIFPNPASTSFSLDLPEDFNADNTVMTVYDLYGRVVMQEKGNRLFKQHQIHDWSLGMYLISIESQQVKKAVKLLLIR